MELDFQLTIAQKLDLLDAEQVRPAQESCVAVQRMLTRLIVTVRPATDASRGRPRTENGEP
jgi:hypothetical protein